MHVTTITASRGFTLLEMAVACAVSAILLVALGTLFIQSANSLDYLTNSAQAEITMRRAIDGMTSDLRQAIADTSGVPPYPEAITVTSGASYDSLTLTRARGGDPIEDPVGNIETVTYTVDADRTLAKTVTWFEGGMLHTRGPLVIARNMDGPTAGTKGFSITRTAGTDLYTISMRVGLKGSGSCTRSFATSVEARS